MKNLFVHFLVFIPLYYGSFVKRLTRPAVFYAHGFSTAVHLEKYHPCDSLRLVQHRGSLCRVMTAKKNRNWHYTRCA